MIKKLTAKQKRTKRIIDYLQHYIDTYSQQRGYIDYSDETIIDDMLYGLGVALNGKEYIFADGYKKFQKVLLDHINKLQ